jgi:peptidoglycan/xylan/chitin deacetylase (PgdA/CDA1 family)
MILKQHILPFVAFTLSITGLNRLYERFYGGRGIILTFHGIRKNGSEAINISGNVTQSFLDSVLGAIKKKGLEPIHLEDVPEYISSNNKKRFIAITFDDGYQNNIEMAVPLLEKYKIPATIFVTSSMLNDRVEYEWLGLEEYIKNNNFFQIENLSYKIDTIFLKQKAYQDFSQVLLSDYKKWKPKLISFLKSNNINLSEITSKYLMTVEQLKDLSRNELIKIGGHTSNHCMLSALNEEEAFREIIDNKKDIEDFLNNKIQAFAYPYGGPKACGERDYELAQKAGYEVAVTTLSGSILNEHIRSLYNLPRIGVSGLYENYSMIDFYLSGSCGRLRQIFKRFLT